MEIPKDKITLYTDFIEYLYCKKLGWHKADILLSPINCNMIIHSRIYTSELAAKILVNKIDNNSVASNRLAEINQLFNEWILREKL